MVQWVPWAHQWALLWVVCSVFRVCFVWMLSSFGRAIFPTCAREERSDHWSCLGFPPRGGFRGRGRGRGRYFRGARQGTRNDSNSNDVSVLAKSRSSMLFVRQQRFSSFDSPLTPPSLSHFRMAMTIKPAVKEVYKKPTIEIT